MRPKQSILVALIVLLTSTFARAEPDAATKEKARVMGTKGLSHYDNGDYAKAVEQFEPAYGLYRAPTLGLYSARALAKLGRLTQASARYLEVMNLPLAKDAPAQFAEAQSAAAAERTELIQRIPRLRVEIAGSGEGDATVTVDGVAVDLQALSAGVQLNPGAHEVRGQLGDKPAQMTVPLQEGETRTITLDLSLIHISEPTRPY